MTKLSQRRIKQARLLWKKANAAWTVKGKPITIRSVKL